MLSSSSGLLPLCAACLQAQLQTVVGDSEHPSDQVHQLQQERASLQRSREELAAVQAANAAELDDLKVSPDYVSWLLMHCKVDPNPWDPSTKSSLTP